MASVSLSDIRYIPFPAASQYCDVGWLPRMNIRKAYGSEREMQLTRDLLATPMGWDTAESVIGEPASEEEVKEMVEARSQKWEQLKAKISEKDLVKVPIVEDSKTISIDGRDYATAQLAVFEWHYVDSRGHLKKTKVLGATCNRRGACLLDAMTVQYIIARRAAGDDKLQPKDLEDKITTHIVVKVPDTPGKRFPDVAVRKQCQVAENERKTAGFKPLTASELLESVLDLVENHGKSQTDIRGIIDPKNPAKGIRVYFACIVDIYCRQRANDHSLTKEERKKWSQIEFLARLMKPQYVDEDARKANKVTDGWLDFVKFNQDAFQGVKKGMPMGNMCESQAKFDKVNQTRTTAKTALAPLVRPSVEMVQEWITTCVAGDSSAPIMKRESIGQLTDTHSNPCVKDAMRAVVKNDVEQLRKSAAIAGVVNFVYGLNDEQYKAFEVLCLLIDDLDAPIQNDLIKKFTDRAKEFLTVSEPETVSVE